MKILKNSIFSRIRKNLIFFRNLKNSLFLGIEDLIFLEIKRKISLLGIEKNLVILGVKKNNFLITSHRSIYPPFQSFPKILKQNKKNMSALK